MLNLLIILIVTHLGLGITGGTDGVGFDLETRIGEWVGIRAGFTGMPAFDKTVHYRPMLGDGTMSEEMQASRFEQMSGVLQDLMGVPIRREVDLVGRSNWWNGRLLVDVYPFRDKGWFFTAGIYMGPNDIMNIANCTEDAPSLLALKTYNNIYEKIKDEEYSKPIVSFNGEPINLSPTIAAQLRGIGPMRVRIGERADGTTYYMEPDGHGMVKAKIRVNMARPYIGFGYKVAITRDKMTHFRFNAGILCWGNAKLLTYDGEDLTQLKGISDVQIVKYVGLVRQAKVFPMVNIQFSRDIF